MLGFVVVVTNIKKDKKNLVRPFSLTYTHTVTDRSEKE
jgi:hypothetical protein